MATLLSDDFNRANSTTVVGSPAIGPAPVIASGACGISANQWYVSTAVGITTYDLGTPDVDITIVANAVSATNFTGVIIGFASLTDFWGIGLGSDECTILRATTGGTAVLTARDVPVLTTGSVLRVVYKDQILRAYVNGALAHYYLLDTPITATRHGLRHTQVTSRVDSIVAVDSTSVNMDFTGESAPEAWVGFEGTPFIPSAFVYQGHDTKLQDQAAGA